VTIVISIILILVGIASPMLKNVAETAKLKSTAKMIRSLLLYARDVAITEGTDYLVVFDLDNQIFWLSDRSALDQGDLTLSLLGGSQTGEMSYEEGAQGGSSSTTPYEGEGEGTTVSRTSMILGVPKKPHENVRIIALETNHEAGRQIVTRGLDYIPFSMLGTSESSKVYLASPTGKYMAVVVKRSGIISIERVSEEELQSAGVDLTFAYAR